jgi:hypothetical protein
LRALGYASVATHERTDAAQLTRELGVELDAVIKRLSDLRAGSVPRNRHAGGEVAASKRSHRGEQLALVKVGM